MSEPQWEQLELDLDLDEEEEDEELLKECD
jgi:hypothetical protein